MKKYRLLIVWVFVLALTSCTTFRPASIDKAEKLVDQDKLDQAEEVYEELIDEDEEDYEAWFGLVALYMDDDEYEDAADVMEDMAEVILDEADPEDDEDLFEDYLDYLEDIIDEDVDVNEYEYINAVVRMAVTYGPDEEDTTDSGFTDNDSIFSNSDGNMLRESHMVGVAMPTKSLQRWNQDGANLKAQLEEAGYEVDLQYADNSPEIQAEQIENMIANGVEVLIIASIYSGALEDQLQNAADEGIIVIAYDRLITGTPNVDYYATFDNYLVGRIQGEYIIDTLRLEDGAGPFNIELFAGSPDDNNAKFFNIGAMDQLQEYIDNGQLVVVSGQTDFNTIAIQNWHTENALSRMEEILNNYYSYYKVEVVLSPNDSLAQGITQACEAAGYQPGYDFPIITGQDCDINSVKNILAGKQSMSIFKDTRTLVDRVVTMITQIMEDEEVEVNDTETFDGGFGAVPTYLCVPVYIDINNYETILVDSGYYTMEELN